MKLLPMYHFATFNFYSSVVSLSFNQLSKFSNFQHILLLNSWIARYSKEGGQDSRSSRERARRHPGEALRRHGEA